MSDPIINLRDLEFQLFEVLDAAALTARSRYADHSRETFRAAIETAHAIAVDKFAPHNRKSDEHEPRFEGGTVTMIPEVREAVRAFCDAGLLAAGYDYERGGMQLPTVVAQACSSLFKSANIATASYPGLTLGNANVINRFGSPAQQARYLPSLLSGRFLGTMALTEPQAGSSLADIRTTATPNGDGSYSIVGNKIFISGGDHQLSENIVHLVLARIDGAPAGVRGLSLFIVPKIRVADDGSLGEHNDVTLTGLIHKMGWRGTTSTMLAFGENGRCAGELIGGPNQGLPTMFHMMNEARIGVGMGAVMLGYRGYLASLAYARERPQGRDPGSKDVAGPQMAIIGHADVKRMLLAQKAYVEGGYALCLHAARLVDEQRTGDSDDARQNARRLLDLLTPVVKAWPSQWCLEANNLAIQVHGGYGFTREYPVEQFYRDNRLNPIHEGTNGIQAIDLLGRKVLMEGGQPLKLLVAEVGRTIAQARALDPLRRLATQLAVAVQDIEDTVERIARAMPGNPTATLANATPFLDVFGHTVVAWHWLRQAVVAVEKSASIVDAADTDFYRGKVQACQWFFAWELPKTQAWHALLRSFDDSTAVMADTWF